MKISIFENCYNDQWRGLITPDSHAHPAKFSPGLIKRIYGHCLFSGYLKVGDVVVDPFGGIGGGGLFAPMFGLRWRGVELEEKFVDLARQNFRATEPGWRTMNWHVPTIIQGDSRRLCDVIGGAAGIVTSPPYAEISDTGGTRGLKKYGAGLTGGEACFDKYGQTEGQIGNLKAGSIDAVCTSPPYAESIQSQAHGIDWAKAGPATGNRKRGDGCKQGETFDSHLNYSADPSNIGNLRSGDVAAVVTSPPWEESVGTKDQSFWDNHNDRQKNWKGATRQTADYGQTEGQLGQASGDTYWQAVADVYRECWEILKPGGVIVIVVKSYVKKGRRVPLPMQTLKLLISLGFEPVERIKASLVKEEIHNGLFGEFKTKKERKSFFRRLAEKKGSPRIDWEEVLICRKDTTI